jgi:AraC-like DNA-binding protein
VAFAGVRVPPAEEADEPEAAPQPSEDAVALVARLERLVRTHGLYRQPDLTLNRLAKRAQLPARHVSNAVNRVRGESVSRFINGIRVAEACRLLATTRETVTEVMGSAGFQTKSNFNRVFREVTGMGPAEWRQAQAAGAVTVVGTGPGVDAEGRVCSVSDP